MTTLREHLEAIRDLSSRPAITEQAEAALAILNEAARIYRNQSGDPIEARVVPDPGSKR